MGHEGCTIHIVQGGVYVRHGAQNFPSTGLRSNLAVTKDAPIIPMEQIIRCEKRVCWSLMEQRRCATIAIMMDIRVLPVIVSRSSGWTAEARSTASEFSSCGGTVIIANVAARCCSKWE